MGVAKKQLCVDCVHFRRCFDLVPDLRGDENECNWDPSRFERSSSEWDRATHRAWAVGRGGPKVAEILNMKENSQKALKFRKHVKSPGIGRGANWRGKRPGASGAGPR